MYTMGTETAPPSRDWCVDQMSTIEQFVERLVYSKVKVKLLSRVRLFATPWTVAYEAPPSMEFSRQEYWSGLSFPSPGDLPHPRIEPGSPSLQADALTIWATREAPSIYCCCCWVTSVCPTLCDPIDGSPPGSPVPGILQARTLEWIAISFSSAWKWSRSVVSDSSRPQGLQPTRRLHPWDSPGKSTGVGAIAFSAGIDQRLNKFGTGAPWCTLLVQSPPLEGGCIFWVLGPSLIRLLGNGKGERICWCINNWGP